MDKYGFLLADDRCAASVGSGSADDSAAARDDARRLEQLLDRMHPSGAARPGSQSHINAQNQLKHYARRGFPDELRQRAWAMLADVDSLIYKHEGEYDKLVDRAESEWLMYELERTVDEHQGKQTEKNPFRNSLDIIERDIHRTFPKHYLFQRKREETSEVEFYEFLRGGTGESPVISDDSDDENEDGGKNIQLDWADFVDDDDDDIATIAESMGTDGASVVEDKRLFFTENLSRSMRSFMGHLDFQTRTTDSTHEESDDDADSTVAPVPNHPSGRGFMRKGSLESIENLGQGEGRDALRRVLRAYCLYDADIGYCQGMNFIVAFFLTFLSEEEEAFWLLVTVMNRKPYMLRELFAEDMRGTHEVFYLAEKLLAQFLPKLSKHLEAEGVHVSMFIPRWLLTVYTSAFPFDLVARVWDCFLVEGWKVVYRVMLALLEHASGDILTMRFEEILAYIQVFPSKVVDGQAIMDRSLKIPLKKQHIQRHISNWRKHADGMDMPDFRSKSTSFKAAFISRVSSSSAASASTGDNQSCALGDQSTTNYAVSINALSPGNELCCPRRSSMSKRTLDESLCDGIGRKTSPRPGPTKRSVSFSDVSIREYERILGDNPSVTRGCPIGIGDCHTETVFLDVDDYENAKGEPRKSNWFLLDQAAREEILFEHTNITRKEMVAVIKKVRKEKAQRVKTVVNLNMLRAEEKAEDARLKARGMFNKSSTPQATEAALWKNAHVIALEKAKRLEQRIQKGESVTRGDVLRVGTPCLDIMPSRRNSDQSGYTV